MTEKITYIAFDDTEFEDEDECIAYENQLIFNKSSIELWNRYGSPITEFSPNTFEDVCFILIKNEADEEFLRDNFPYSIEWDDSEFYFLSENECCYISLKYYKNKYLEQNYLTALEINRKRGIKGAED